MGICAPNHTQVPNMILDIMAEMLESEFRVTLAIVRKTFGFQKERDRLSISQLMELTGLSRPAVIKGTELALARGFIERHREGDGFVYDLVVNEIDSQQQSASQSSLPEVVNQVDRQKKVLKKDSSSATTEKNSLHSDIMAAYQESLGYKITDGAVSGKAAKQLVQLEATPEKVAACYRYHKAKPYWSDKHLSLMVVAREYGAWVAAGCPGYRGTDASAESDEDDEWFEDDVLDEEGDEVDNLSTPAINPRLLQRFQEGFGGS